MEKSGRDDAPIVQSPTIADVVCIKYDDLLAACMNSSSSSSDARDIASDGIERAFSSSGLGIVAITDVPNLSGGRIRLLRMSRELATLPRVVLDGITRPESTYQVGWVSVHSVLLLPHSFICWDEI
jgi:hypothetical protein